MRERLIHGYDLVDWDEVWQTARKDIPDHYKKLNNQRSSLYREPVLPNQVRPQ